MKNIRAWKKVYLNDLEYIVSELKEVANRPCCLILSGEVGVGKTTFVQKFVPGSKITSPSYSLINEIGALAHADFYRLKDESELIEMELGLYLEDKDYFLVEWGKDHINLLRKEVPDEFIFYELVIGLNDKTDESEQAVSRNLDLFELS